MARSYGESMKPSADNPRETRARIALLAPSLRFLRPYWPRVLGASAALVFTASVTLSLGQGLRMLVDQGFVSGSAEQLNRAVLVFMLIVLLLAIGTFTRFYLVSWIGERVDGGSAPRGVRPRAVAASGLLRDQRRGRDPVAHHRRYHAAADRDRLLGLDRAAQPADARRRRGAAVRHEPAPDRHRAAQRAAGAAADRGVRPARAHAVARQPGPARECRRLSSARRSATSRPCRPSTTRAWTAQRFAMHVEDTFRASIRRVVQRSWLTAMVIVLVLGAVGAMIWVGGNDVIAGRIDAGRAHGLHLLRGDGGGRGGGAVGGDRRSAARRRRHRAADGIVARDAADPCAGRAPAAAGAAARRDRAGGPALRAIPRIRSVPRSTASRCTCRPDPAWRWWAPPGAGKSTLVDLLLRFYEPDERQHPARRHRHARRRSAGAATAFRAGAAAAGAVLGLGAGQHPLRRPRGER